MSQFETEGGTTRDELVQRIELMESMIAQGRRSTVRCGWMFLMWGVIYFAAIGWEMFLPYGNWAWPVCIGIGVAIIVAVKSRERRANGCKASAECRCVESVWKMMGIGITLFVFAAMATHHAGGIAFAAAILFFIGLAHAISAVVLRWGVQGAVAAIWWVGGIATFFFTKWQEMIGIFLTASFFGMIVFGVYAMMLERRGGGEKQNA